MTATRHPVDCSVDGVALLDKPAGQTSHQALERLRRHLNADKAGHAGTLDPMATGLLLIAFGEATKFAQQWLEADKTYTFRVVFGVATDTGDADGDVTATMLSAVTEAQLTAVLPAFRGTIEQTPPMVSALKHQGKPLYRLARQGVTVERQPRRVTIHRLELLTFDPPHQRAVLQATVSKGTYIRTLAEQIGAALGVPAHIDQLRREAIGPFSVADAWSLAEWPAHSPEAARAALLPPDRLVAHLPAVLLGAAHAERFRHGQTVAGENLVVGADPTSSGALPVRVYERVGAEARFLGVGEWHPRAGHLSPKRVIAKLLPLLPLPEAIGTDLVLNRSLNPKEENCHVG